MYHNDNPYLSLFQNFKISIDQNTTKEQAIQVSRQLAHIHNATGIIIADLIKCLGFRYKLASQSHSSTTPSTQLKQIQNQVNFQRSREQKDTINLTLLQKNHPKNLLEKNINDAHQILSDQKFDGKSSSSLSNTEPFQIFEYKNVCKKLQKQLKKIDKQKINSAIQSITKVKPEQKKSAQIQNESFQRQNRNKTTKMTEQTQIPSIFPFKQKKSLIKYLQDQLKQGKGSRTTKNNGSLDLEQLQNQPNSLNNKLAFSRTQNQKQFVALDKAIQLQQNSMIEQGVEQDEQYEKIGDFNNLNQNKLSEQHIQRQQMPTPNNANSSLQTETKAMPKLNQQAAHPLNATFNQRKRHEVIQILSDDQN